jgi:transcriptional regulator with XRE-family HTH domain
LAGAPSNGSDRLSRLATSEIQLASRDAQSDKALGARLREIRGRRSREEFGAELGTHRNTVERYEKGLRPMDTEFLRKVIEKNPGWSYDWLATGRGEKHAPRGAGHRVESPAAPPYNTINEHVLEEVIREIEAAAGDRLAKVSAEKRAALIAAVYDDAVARGAVSRETVLRLVKLTI